ncbi:cation diffusion facilitator family transporter [Mesoaciditoga sp.]
MERDEVRTLQSLKAIKIGIYGNIVLALLKITLGIFGLSISLIADGVDTISDVVKSIFVYRAVEISSRPPSREYPYGYGRAETVITNIVGMSVIFAGILIFIESVGDFHKSQAIGMLMIVGAVISILGKIALSAYMFKIAKKFNNQALLANAKDYLSDVFASGAVLVGGLLVAFTHISYFDPLASIVVSGIIGYMGFEIVKSGIPEIMEKNENSKMIEEIYRIIKDTPYTFHPHKIRIRKLGPYYLVDMHVELPGQISLKKAHEITTQIEKKVKEKLKDVREIIIHEEPIGNGKDEW